MTEPAQGGGVTEPAQGGGVTQPPRGSGWRGEVAPGLVVAVAVSALGAPLGLIWAALCPHLRVALGEISPTQFIIVPDRTEDPANIGGDGVMLLVLAVAGLLVGLAVLGTARRRPIGAVVGVLTGGVAAGAIALAVGHISVRSEHQAVFAHGANGMLFSLRPYVRGDALIGVLPLVALLVYLAVDFVSWLSGRGPRAREAG